MLDCQLDNEGNPKAARPKERVRIKGIREHMEIQRVKQLDKQGPDSWFVRKFAVGIVAAIFAYSYYVYVVRLCIPMVRMEDSRLGARAQGLAYLVIYHFLFVMFVWSYIVAVWTQPGYARDYVSKTDPPQAEEHYIDVIAGQPFEQQPQDDRTRRGRRDSVDEDSAADEHERESVQDEVEADTIEMHERRRRSLAPSAADEEDRLAEQSGATAALGPDIASAILNGTRSPSSRADAVAPSLAQDERGRSQSTASTTLGPSSDRSALTSPPKAHLRARSPASTSPPPDDALPRPSRSSGAPSYLAFPEPPDDYEPPKRLPVERIPRNAPVLTEQYRYDAREGIVRPYRSHRCRHCAAVVLKMDHHCPWVGTCVGARNYKYFYNFLQYSSTYTLFVWLTLLIAQTLPLGTFSPSTGRPYPGVDGQQVAIIVLAFLFWLFTGALFAAHTRLVLRNMTTIEEIGMNRTKQRERAALNQHYGFWQWRCVSSSSPARFSLSRGRVSDELRVRAQGKAGQPPRVGQAVGSPRDRGQPVVARVQARQLGDGHGHAQARMVLAHSGEAARRRRAQLRAEPEVQREGRVEDAARVAKGVPVSGPDRAAPRRRLSIFPATLSSSLLFCYSHLQRTASHHSKRAREREAEVGSGALPWLVVRRSWLSLLTRRLSHTSTAAIEGTAQLDSRSELQRTRTPSSQPSSSPLIAPRPRPLRAAARPLADSMSTPVARSVLTEPGPLGPGPDTACDPQDAALALLSSSPHSPPPSTSSGPLSFKRRAAQSRSGRDKSSRGGILGGILSRSHDDDGQPDMVPNPPALRRPEAPSHIALPPGSHLGGSAAHRRAGASDDEDDDDKLLPGAGGALGGKGWRRRLPSAAAQRRMLSAGAGAQGAGAGPRSRRSTGASAFLSPSKEPGMLSPAYSPSARGGGEGGGGAGDGTLPSDAGPIAVTPLPKIPIFVLSICMLGEFLSASVCSPFLFFMVESFGVGENGGGESAVSLWTGVVAAVFFLSQFLTAMIWVSVADKHGRRAVLCASLLGNGLTVMAFGTSRNLGTAICTRLAMGLFNGAVGVARSAVQDVTDESNRSTAYTILGLLWGMGGIVGSVLGGTLEHPVDKYPRYFGDSQLFAEYPYLLPCMVAGSVTLFGGVISLGLNRDGGQREGGIHLPTEKDVEVAAGTLARVKDWFLARTSSLLNRLPRRPPIHLAHSSGAVSLHPSSAADVPPLPSPAQSPEVIDDLGRGREPSRQQGSAYGYTSSRRASQVNFERDSGLRIPSMRRRGFRSASMATTSRYDADSEVPHSFAERLLLAQNQAVFSLSDVFLAKAAAEDDFHAVEYDGSVFERDDDEESRIEGVDHDGANSEYDGVGFGTAPPSMDDLRGEAARQAAQAPEPPFARPGSPSHSLAPQPQPQRAPRRGILLSPTRDRVVSHATTPSRQRRVSTSSSVRPMSIYDNSGLAPETIASAAGQLVAQHQQQLSAPTTPDESRFSPMAAIPETRAASIIEHAASDDDASTVIDYGGGGPSASGELGSGANSVVWQLPLAMIAQYLCVGMHGTACDQMFTSFLVTPIASGGLGLSADHYAALVATMFFFSLIWQFRFYSAVGPPNGPLSHLSMFRLGLILYVPVYLLFPELRGLVGDGDKVGLVMLGMIVLSAIRYLANACAYTAVMVLINVMTPPELVPLANGLAQSCISLARFIGPLLGGSVFAASIADPANAHPSAGFHLIAALCFFGFVLSWRIK